MRLMRNDMCRLVHGDGPRVFRVAYINAQGTIAFVGHVEANADARTRAKELAYVFKTAGSLQKASGRQVFVSPAGDLRDPGFSG